MVKFRDSCVSGGNCSFLAFKSRVTVKQIVFPGTACASGAGGTAGKWPPVLTRRACGCLGCRRLVEEEPGRVAELRLAVLEDDERVPDPDLVADPEQLLADW